MFGLKKSDIKEIKTITAAFPEVIEIIIYGSRALGTHKPGSDVDICLKGDISFDSAAKINYRLNEESTMPYFFDITPYNSIKNEALREHVNSYGVKLF